MGALLLVCRLAVKDLRHRPAQAILLLLAIAAGAATLTPRTGARRYDEQPVRENPSGDERTGRGRLGLPRRFECSRADRRGQTGRRRRPGWQRPAERSAELEPLEHASGVVASSGPFPVTWTLLQNGHTTGSAEVEGRSTAQSSVDQPKLLQGTWVRPGGVVVEAGFASALGLHVGDRTAPRWNPLPSHRHGGHRGGPRLSEHLLWHRLLPRREGRLLQPRPRLGHRSRRRRSIVGDLSTRRATS